AARAGRDGDGHGQTTFRRGGERIVREASLAERESYRQTLPSCPPRARGRERSSEPQVYLPYQQVPDEELSGYIPKDLVVRTAAPSVAGNLLPRIREIIKSADPEQPISQVRMVSEILAEETASRVTQLRLLGALSAIALLIAGLGIH